MKNSLIFVYYLYADHRDLHVLTHSFPARRSSDRLAARGREQIGIAVERLEIREGHVLLQARGRRRPEPRAAQNVGERDRPAGPRRSEEHTSELQSLMRTSYAVFCLKKNKPTNTPNFRNSTYLYTHNY